MFRSDSAADGGLHSRAGSAFGYRRPDADKSISLPSEPLERLFAPVGSENRFIRGAESRATPVGPLYRRFARFPDRESERTPAVFRLSSGEAYRLHGMIYGQRKQRVIESRHESGRFDTGW